MSHSKQLSISVTGAEQASPLTLSSITEQGAWVVQGVVPKEDRKRMTEDGDGVWYAQTVNEIINSMISDWETSLDDIMREAIYVAADRYAAEVNDLTTIDLDTLPSAVVSCVRWDEYTGGVEYFNIGDAVAMLYMAHGDFRVCATDASLSKSGFDSEDQWRLSFSPEAIDYARSGTLPDHDIKTIDLFSTACDAAVEIYGLYDSWDAFRADVDQRGATSVVEDIHHHYETTGTPETISVRPGVRDVSLLSVNIR